MKILILPPYFEPEVQASAHLDDNRYSAFSEAGMDMLVFTPSPTRGIDDEIRASYKQKKDELLYNNRLSVHRFSMYREGKNPIGRAFRYIFCFIKQLYFGLRAKDIDVIFLVSTPPIQGVLGGILKKIKKVPFIYNLQDIFPDSLVGTGLAKENGLLWKIGRVIENFTYRNADKIIVISEDFKKNIMAKGVPESKIEVIYNWVDEQAVVDVPRYQNKLVKKYNLNPEDFFITYSGNIGLTQNMDMLLEVAKDFEKYPSIKFVLIGEGAYKAQVEKRVNEEHLQNVIMLPFQPYEDISHVFSLGNVGLVISKPNVGANSVPSKTWSIMSASRSVLANFDENELKTIIEDHHCGVFTKAGDKEAFEKAILSLYENKQLCEELGKNGRRFIEENLTKAVGTKKNIDVVLQVVNSKKK